MTLLTAFAAVAARRSTVPRQDDSPVRPQLPSMRESGLIPAMMPAPTALPPELPGDIDALRALIVAERTTYAAVAAERDQFAARAAKLEATNTTLEATNTTLEAANARLAAILAEVRRAHFGRKSERITDDQLALALDELETAAATVEAEVEKADPAVAVRARKRRASRNETFDHLPHEDVVIMPEAKSCPCCGGALHVIGEDVSKRLDKIPAQFRVIVTHRPKFGCRTCEKTGADGADVGGHPKRPRETAGIIQAPAPARLIEGGLPTERLVADVVVSKYADHLPLYRQSQMMARQGVRIERSTLAQWG